MKRYAPALAAGFALILAAAAPALAQEGSLLTLSWGPSGVPGLKYRVACSALSGSPSWDYTFENVTSKPITFSYSFGDENIGRQHHVYWYTVPPRGRWTLRHVARHDACDTNGPLDIEPEATP